MKDLNTFFLKRYNKDISNIDEKKPLEDIVDFEGSDGIEFIDDFFTTFNIKVDHFNYKEFIRSDGLMIFLPKFFVKKRKILRLKHIINSYKKGVWEYYE